MKKAFVFKPEYYDSFTCKASACRQTCCREWSITASKPECRKIRNCIRGRGDFPGEKYFELLPPEKRTEAVYAQIVLNEEKYCPFLSSEKLCTLQKTFGAEILPDTCIWFPRSAADNHGLTCATLTPACERVMEMLPTDRSLVFEVKEQFLDGGFPPAVPLQQRYMEKNYRYAAYFQDIHSMCILILQAQDVSLEDRMILLGLGLENILRLGEEQQWDSIPGYVENYISQLGALEDVSLLIPSFPPSLPALFNNFLMADFEPEGSGSDYGRIIDRVKERLQISYQTDSGAQTASAAVLSHYEELKKGFGELMADRPFFMENLLLSILTCKNIPFAWNGLGGIWGNYVYLCWIYSSLKLVLTVCAGDIHSQEELVDLCIPLMRRWVHSGELAARFVEIFEKNDSSTLAHMAVLLKSC